MDEKVYLLTDGCGWEINKETGNEHPHSIEVVDIETGAVRYITSGSKVKFIEGKISDLRTQKAYNEATTQMPSNKQGEPNGKPSKRKSKKAQQPSNHYESVQVPVLP